MKAHPPDFDPNLPPDDQGGQLDPQIANQAAHNGLGIIASMRLRHAERVVENMDRKDRLYAEIGHAAASGRREAPVHERPQTLPERAIDFRLQRKSDKKIRHDVYAHRAKLIHGQDSAPHVPSVRHGATESILGATLGRSHSHTFGQVLWGNVKRVFEGPHIPGFTGLKRMIEKAKVVGRVATNEVTAAEAREQWLAASAHKMKLGNKMHKRARRQARKHDERANLVAEGPVRQTWRSWRRERAQRIIDRLQNQ